MPNFHLPFLKQKKEDSHKATSREYFLALEISHGVVKSAVWSVINDKTQVLSVGASSDWDDATPDSLVTASDASLTDCLSKLDPQGKISPDKVIFGLPPDWIEADKISPSRLQFLKIISQKLSLRPVGYVVTPEAVVRFLAHSEGVPPTAICLGFWSNFVEVTLVRLGKIIGIHEVSRSPHPAADVLEGLSRFTHIDMFPSRMLLYDSGLHLENIKQQLLTHPWQAPQNRLPFLHFPKIEVLPPDFTVRAIALSGGAEVAKASGLLPDQEETAPVEPPSADLGFYPPSHPPSPAPLPQPPPPHPYPPAEASPVRNKLPPLPNFKLKFPRVSFSPGPVLISLFLILILGGLGLAYWYLPKSKIVLQVTPRTLTTQFEFVADAASPSADLENSILPSLQLSASVDGSQTTNTTGTLLVGDKATGSVTISNALDTPKTFPAGTTINTPSGLKFLLMESVTVASASGSAGNLLVGKAPAKITAAQIGSDSNLTAGTTFRVASFAVTQISALNETAFSGGSSRTVAAVDKNDISSLRSQLSSSLNSSLKDKLSSQLSPDQLLLAETLQTETPTESFDHKLGDAADSLTLSLSLSASATAVSRSDIFALVKGQIQSQIPEGYEFSGDPEFTFSVLKASATKATIQTQAKASLLPRFDSAQIAQAVSGKSLPVASTYLESLPGVSHVDVIFSPPLPKLLLVLPRLPSHISVSVSPQ